MQRTYRSRAWSSVSPERLTTPGRATPRRPATALRLLDAMRLARFALVGTVAGGVQLGLLAVLLVAGLAALPANAIAFLLSAQLNFALSTLFIWGDRDAGARPVRGLVRRWLAFHLSIAGTALLNQAVFVLARAAMPDLPASALGIGVGAAVNFAVQDRFVFRRTR